VDDIDPVFHLSNAFDHPKFVVDLSELALDCMVQFIEDRPNGDEVMARLASILDAATNYQGPKPIRVTGDNESRCVRCQTYPKYPGNNICHFCWMIDKFTVVLIKLDEIIPVLTALDGKFNNPVPRLFILYPAEKTKIWKHPKSWLNSKVQDKYRLQFVCAYSFQAIEPSIKVKITKDWIVTVAPVLAVSLHIMSIALYAAASVKVDVSDAANKLFAIDKHDLKDMIEQVYTVVDDKTRKHLQSNFERNNHVNALSSTAYDVISELALKQHGWMENMKQVKQKNNAATLWVAKHLELNESNGYETIPSNEF
jgi:hypothetical protein